MYQAGNLRHMRPTLPFLLGIFLTAASIASVPALYSATIQADGPRKGPTGGVYLNAEGAGKGKYASFGVIDFGPVAYKKEKKVKITLAQSNANFTADGSFKVCLAAQSTPVLNLRFDAKVMGTFGAEKMRLTPLGSADFKKGAGAKADTFVFPISAEAAKILKGAKNVRIVLLPSSATVAATYAGAEHKSLKHPQLELLP